MTVLQTHCPACGRALSLPENMLGQQVRCPICNHVFPAAEQTGPPPAAVQPQAAPSAPRFDREEPPPRPRTPARPEAYEEYGEEGYGRRARYAARARAAAAVWMLVAGILDLLVLLVFYVFIFTVDGRPPHPRELLIFSFGALVFYIVPLVFMFIAAGVMRTARGSGLIITGSVMSFIIALELLILAGIFGIGIMITLTDRYGRERMPFAVPIVFVLALAGLILSMVAGVKALIAVSRDQPRSPDYY
jgi:uncharacterized Zn finger protein (UPF0148 family)